MTGKRCKVCEHIDRKVIDGALSVGQLPRSITRAYSGISRREIQRHRNECLRASRGEGA